MADEYMMEEEEEETSTGKKVEFDMPKGDGEFEELRPGEKMRVQCTIRKEEGGRACLVAVNGAEVSGYEEEEESEETEEGSGFDEMLDQQL